MPAFLATASSPFFSMVFKAFVDRRSLTKRLPASHQTFLYCKLTNCNFLVLWLEKETLLALFAFFPVKGQILPNITKPVSKTKKANCNKDINQVKVYYKTRNQNLKHTCRHRDITWENPTHKAYPNNFKIQNSFKDTTNTLIAYYKTRNRTSTRSVTELKHTCRRHLDINWENPNTKNSKISKFRHE